MLGVSFLAMAVQQVPYAPAVVDGSDGRVYLWIALGVGVLALVAALMLARAVIASDTGTPEMRAISDAIREGAEAFLRRQYKTIGAIALVLAVVVFVGYKLSPRTSPYALKTVVSFLVGAVCSGLAGFTGMYCSIRANIRTASAARTSLNKALQMALRGGAVTGLVVVALSLLGVGVLFLFFGGLEHPQAVPYQLVGFGFGASLVALFAQLGGGIYTKAADVGADLVGKVEAGIPEDDPRNPAVIADLVGDNVGDCAGRGADLFESTAAENVGAMILGAALYPVFGVKGILFPLIVHAINLIASIVGVFVVSTREDEDPMHALNKGFYVTSALALAGFAGAVYTMLNGPQVQPIWLLGCGVIGLVTAFLFVWITEYYTEAIYRPVKSIVEASVTGPATNIISGLAVGMETPAMPVVVISAALLLSYYFGVQGLAGVAGISDYAKGIYGTAIATMGMLSCAAYILAMDTFGPITDNAGGIIEMSNQPHEIRDRTDKLDSAGNTTKALTKGYAIGSASLAAFLLFSAYLEEIKTIVTDKVALAGGYMPPGWSFTNINLAQVPVFVGALLGAMLTYLFSSLAIKAVGRTAQMVVKDVRDQFKENPGIMLGSSKPDYARCVNIVTGAALKEMVVPGLLAVGLPVAVGLIFRHLSSSYQANSALYAPGAILPVPAIGGVPVNLAGAEAVAGLLMVGTISGVLLAMLMNNGGGAWDNAKKFIETGQYGGKKSEAHKAAVVGDTVGDPFKDTAGPSLHVLIKLLATITLVLAPLFV
ncbi:K(+)-stimulated pyrophosphate-energized sodium pump [Edaphobacter lichenicola]|jgi:K(+)-stimulated pyrophosphate-energized sodium pump|uniref:K(+)-insensitive pyrophosphate-energized proton pump n=2 Tax=Tunturiibacter gelidiferens TaxID=3069689 RepID=A0A9X0U4R1_9BACT|nr:sodium-translocating pyrophosphatase [Edaphobacter lichenicola]MBB5329230.1 K(+)-stimulated pyrophosphate-energized sodium pump [Edaphobacter lichenicola]